VLELESPALGCEKMDPELPDPLLAPLSVELLEPVPLLELPELLEDVPLDVLATVVEEWVSPHMPRKTPIVAAATPSRSRRRAVGRAAGERTAASTRVARAVAICRPAVARVMSPCGLATQLST